MVLASAPTFSRLEHGVTSKDLYRVASAFVDGFIASYATPPELIVLDLDHSEDRTHGAQERCVYNGYYGSHCYLPLFVFEGLSGKFITAVLRPGHRPTGAENASIVKRLLKRLRQHWPETHILLRGDSHFAANDGAKRTLSAFEPCSGLMDATANETLSNASITSGNSALPCSVNARRRG